MAYFRKRFLKQYGRSRKPRLVSFISIDYMNYQTKPKSKLIIQVIYLK